MAVYDPGAFYVKGDDHLQLVSTAIRRRHINFAGLAPGATFAGTPMAIRTSTCGPSVSMAARASAMGANSVLTPYLNYDYVNAKLKSFTESGSRRRRT